MKQQIDVIYQIRMKHKPRVRVSGIKITKEMREKDEAKILKATKREE